MLCENCGKNEATMHLHQNINGDVKELHLCPECAAALGYDQLFGGMENPFASFGMDIQNLLGGLFAQERPRSISGGHKCPSCGTAFEDFANTAMAGCADCYHEFYSDIIPYVQRIHGKTRHVGKIPAAAGRELKLARELDSLKKSLNDAVAAQEYEKAAEFRDKIKELEGKSKGEQQ